MGVVVGDDRHSLPARIGTQGRALLLTRRVLCDCRARNFEEPFRTDGAEHARPTIGHARESEEVGRGVERGHGDGARSFVQLAIGVGADRHGNACTAEVKVIRGRTGERLRARANRAGATRTAAVRSLRAPPIEQSAAMSNPTRAEKIRAGVDV